MAFDPRTEELSYADNSLTIKDGHIGSSDLCVTRSLGSSLADGSCGSQDCFGFSSKMSAKMDEIESGSRTVIEGSSHVA